MAVPRTHLADFFLTEHSLVTVEVFRSLGHVRTVYDNTLFPSYVHSAYWDGSTQSGSPAPTGHYRFRFPARSPYCSDPRPELLPAREVHELLPTHRVR